MLPLLSSFKITIQRHHICGFTPTRKQLVTQERCLEQRQDWDKLRFLRGTREKESEYVQ